MSAPARQQARHSVRIDALADRIRSLEDRWRVDAADASSQPITHGAVGSLQHGRLHEWFGDESNAPPLAVFIDAASHAHLHTANAAQSIIWIGRDVWPYPNILTDDLRQRSVFVDPPDAAARLWAIDLAVRSLAVRVVIADGSQLNLSATRRLQLAAETNQALVMLARPWREIRQRSAAAYRWQVTPVPSVNGNPRWSVQLLRNKDAMNMNRSANEIDRSIVEWRHEFPSEEYSEQSSQRTVATLVAVPAVVADRTATAAARQSA